MHPFLKFTGRWYAYPLLLLFVGVITYLYQLPGMGFYWDDWQAVFLGQINDAQVNNAYFSYDRPFSAWTYNVLFPWLPMTPAAWQIISLLTRVGAIYVMVIALLLIWPHRKWHISWAGLLLLVCPAFTLQSVAVAFNQHLITFLLFSLSMLFTGLAVKNTRRSWVYLPLALAATAAHLFTMEYFVGLEAIRGVYIYLLMAQQKSKWQITLRRTIYLWIPFLMVLAGFIYWRLGVYPSQIQGELPNDPKVLRQLLVNPADTMFELFNRITQDSIFLLFRSWINAFFSGDLQLKAKATLFSFAVGLLSAFLAAVWLNLSGRSSEIGRSDHYHSIGLIFGLLTMVFGGLPVWITGRQITVGKWSDRFSLVPMIGAVFLLVLAVDWLIRTRRQKQVILAILVGLSIAFQMSNVNKYRLDWTIQRDFYWQLAWRAPTLEPGTAVIAPNIPSGKIADYAAAYGINVLYGGDRLSPQAPYWFFTPRDVGFSFAKLEPGYEIHYQLRNIQFTGSTSEAIALHFKSSERCLKVLDPIYRYDPFLADIDPLFFDLTNHQRISDKEPTAAYPTNIFGQEPAHDWCYYFQKADLARQSQKWQEIINLMNEAFQLGYNPAASSELLPLLDAHFQLGQWDQAVAVAEQMMAISGEIRPAICALVQTIEAEQPGRLPGDTISSIQLVAQCWNTPDQ